MDVPASTSDERLVTAADIARLAGVTRAAVSNWRRRHADFPAPAEGAGASPRFSLSEVRAWLDRQDKGGQESPEVRLWHILRDAYPDSMLRGLADVAALLSGSPGSPLPDLPDDAARACLGLAEETSPARTVGALAERLTQSSQRSDADTTTTPRLVRAITRFANPEAATVFDPACGIGSLLLGVGADGARRTGQDVLPEAARFTRFRAELNGVPDVEVRVGDSLRDDQWPDHRAELVVCAPPAATPDWGREDLLIDPRWELGLPPRAESELAWLQHAYAHTAAGGQTVVVMPTAAAHRRTGRRIRAELVRRGLLTEVVALPAGMAVSHAQPVHLWLLRRPSEQIPTVQRVRMSDLTAADPDGPLNADDHPRADVPLVELLDDVVDLTPSRHASAHGGDLLTEYAGTREQLIRVLETLGHALPSLAEGPGDLGGSQVRVADLVDAGLVRVAEGRLESSSERLDADFLNGFLRSTANTRRSTTASGTFRTDARSASVPHKDADQQRAYGRAFRALEEFEQAARELATLAGRATDLAREGLTSGALLPSESAGPGTGPQSEDSSRA
ncbi:N-6 DNA methylase [Nocardiopsis sp. EMB25]|uniref:N-6 DNA methylase n=1 Tax=Nocardiopsis sp. EMB25 TaxID=2835867 RepID=UPI00228354CF|nr:N-6 DNA methylase [Nocardiopsis sp. EMB25]MCY9784216.1 N-6 DNA methylase [Nocardiopsis sp. EMB25]